jgi:hypothetical protein
LQLRAPCGSRTLTAERQIRSAIRRVALAQEAFFADSLRLARSLQELRLEPDLGVRLTIEPLDSARFRVVGQSVRPRGVTCTHLATLWAPAQDAIQCTGRAPGPLGF